MAELVASGLPEHDAMAGDVEFVCLDVETTGLDAATAELLSVGWVLIRHGRVPLATARRLLARPDGAVGDSATVHGLTDTAVAEGLPVGGVVDSVVRALTGRVLVVHHAGLDKALLDRLCRDRYGCALPVPVLDTLAVADARRRGRHHVAGARTVCRATRRTIAWWTRWPRRNCCWRCWRATAPAVRRASGRGSRCDRYHGIVITRLFTIRLMGARPLEGSWTT